MSYGVAYDANSVEDDNIDLEQEVELKGGKKRRPTKRKLIKRKKSTKRRHKKRRKTKRR